jgi:uncharacterized protein
MNFEYWFMLPVSIFVASMANSSGFSGGVFFQPIYYIFLNVPIQASIATGIATETIGMTSGAIRYLYYKMVELPIAFTMIMLAIPGIVIGNHALLIINSDLLKMIVGVIILGLASLQLFSAIMQWYGTREKIPVEDIYPFMWIPPLSGFFSATTGTGLAEISQPLLERGLNLKTKKANATAIIVEAVGDWVITILNLQAGFIRWDIWIWAGIGVLIGGQIGPYISRLLSARFLKIVFSASIIIIGIFYIYKGAQWILGL